MAAMIPPAIITVIGDDAAFVAMMTKDKGLPSDFARQDPRAKLGASSKQFQAELDKVNAKLAKWGSKETSHKLTLKPDFARIDAAIKAWGTTLPEVPLKLNPQFAKLNAALAAWDTALPSYPIKLKPDISAINTALAKWSTSSGAGGAAGSTLGGILSGFFTRKKGGGGGLSTAGLLGVSGAAGMAFDVAGISVTHMAVAGLDLAMSASAALAGGLLKGISGGATLGVGMLTDYAGLGTALQDMRAVEQAQNAVTQAVAVYGKNSLQAQQAQAQLNFTLSQVPAVARSAVLGTANTVQAFKNLFDMLSGPAEAKGAAILTSIVKAMEPFLSIIGKFAAINMGLIAKGLAPLLKWLDSPATTGGKGIFTELEKIFTMHLPTGMSAFVNGFEAMVKVIGKVAPTTGGFLETLARVFTKFNAALSKPGSTANTAIDSLLKDWNAWYTFAKVAVTDVYRLFSGGKDQHTGLTIIKQLTGYLQEFGKWESSVSGTKSITSMFKASKGELTTLLALLPPVAKGIGALILALAPGAHIGMTVALKGLVGVFDALSTALVAMTKFKPSKDVLNFVAGIGGFALAIGFVVTKLSGIPKALSKMASGLADVLLKIPGLKNIPGLSKLATASPNASFATSVGEFAAAVTRFVGETAANLPGKGGLILPAGVGGKTAAAGEATTLEKLLAIAGPAVLAYAVSKDVAPAMKNPVPQSVVDRNVLAGIQKYNTTNAAQLWKDMSNGASTKGGPSKSFLAALKASEAGIAAESKKLGKDVTTGYAKGITGGQAAVNKAAHQMGTGSTNALGRAIIAHSPSVASMRLGIFFDQGFARGITDSARLGGTAVASLSKVSIARLHSDVPLFRGAGASAAEAWAAGFASKQGLINQAAHNAMVQVAKQVLSQMVGGHAGQLATALSVGAGSGY